MNDIVHVRRPAPHLYTRRDLAKLATVGIVGCALEGHASAHPRGLLGVRGAMMGGCSSYPYKRELAWIGNTGTEWIDTGISFNSMNMEFSITMGLDNDLVGGWLDEFLGCMYSDSDADHCVRLRRYGAGNFCDFGFCNNPRRVPDLGFYVQVRNNGFVRLVIKQGFCAGYHEDGSEIAAYTTGLQSKTPCGLNVYVFCGNNAGSPFRISTGMKVKSLIINDGDTNLMDAIPVMDNNNTPCLYNKIDGTLLYNQAEGDFSYGEL